LYIYDLIEQRNVYVNPFVTTVLGYPVQDIQQMDSPLWLNLMHPDDRTELSNPLKQFDTAKDGDIIEREYRLRRADGEYRWLYSRDTVFSRTADGKPKQVLGTAQDITERKLAEAQLKASLQEKELLLKEVHHRVKNNLQVISSLFSLQSQYIDNPEILSLLMESKNRIRAMALIHEKLYQSWTFAKIDFASYIQTLTRNLFASYNISSNRISLCLDVSDVSLTLDDAIPCGLLINELVSNALKHAFPNQQSGEISLQFSLNSDDHFILTVKDNGVGLPPDFTLEQTNSLGMLLVKALSLQLRGHLETQNDNGAVFKVTFPQPKDCNPF
ncbi:MAG TPA: histidine kinase dimerization/phosphoacceptor domain -containing protein, partial [Cyanophyceae cyanobacterium]